VDSTRSALRAVSESDRAPLSVADGQEKDGRPLYNVADRRDVRAIGRRARLELVFGYRRGRTVIAHAYAEPPFRIGQSFEIGSAAYMIIVCSGPGVFAGDDLRQSVRVEPGACVLLGSQAALQAHPGTASSGGLLHHRYAVADDGELHCHWDPLIPFASARLSHRVELDVAGGSRMYWSDALMSGRSARGEDWMFSEVAHELRLRIDGSLKYLERYRLVPGQRDVTAAPIAGEARYLGTTLVHHAAATAVVAEALQLQLDRVNDVRGGVDLVAPSVIAARLLGLHGARFRAARAVLRQHAAEQLFGTRQLPVRR
jgi:urease accessory protein UreH